MSGANKPQSVFWPTGVADCRPTGQAKFSSAARAEQRWFLQSLLVQELYRDTSSTDADRERVRVMPEVLKAAVDAELYAEDFPDTLQFVVDAVSTCSSTAYASALPKSLHDSYRAALIEVLGFCDEATADSALGLLKASSTTVRDFADSVGCLLEHDGNAAGEMSRKLQAALWLQRASANDLITGLGSIGSSIGLLVTSGLRHADASCRARAADVILQAGLHSREREASAAALSVLCRAALLDPENRPFYLSAAWDILLVHPSGSFAPIVSSRSRDSIMDTEETTVLAFLLGYLRFDRESDSEVHAACVTALGSAKLIMHHSDLESTEVIQCRLNAALVQCRRLDEIHSKKSQRGQASNKTTRAPRAGKSKDANPLRIILEDFQRRFKLHCDELTREEEVNTADDADAGGSESYDSRIANAVTWLVVEHLCDCDLSSAAGTAEDSAGDEMETRLQNALSLSPFRQQFDNFASLIQLATDDAQGLTFEMFEQNLCDNLLGNLQHAHSSGASGGPVAAETLHAVLGTLRSSFTNSVAVSTSSVR